MSVDNRTAAVHFGYVELPLGGKLATMYDFFRSDVTARCGGTLRNGSDVAGEARDRIILFVDSLQ